MTPNGTANGPFTVTIEPSGRTFSATASDTLLAAAIAQSINLPYGCKDGACGSCKCKKLSGTVTHNTHQAKALSSEEEAAGFVLTCCAQASSDVVLESKQVTELGALPIKKLPARVSSRQRLSHDVMLLKLQLPANDNFAYRAGQYIEIILRDGARRSYSMANASNAGTGLELHLRHMPGGKFTAHVFGPMVEKEILRFEGPYGSFYLREDSSKPIVLLASGTGFAPVKALLEHMQFLGSTRPVALYWGGRRPQDLYMQDWVIAQQAVMPQLKYVPVLSDAITEDEWTGRCGLVHQAVMQDINDLSGHQVYACGAPAMVDAARRDFSAQAGLPSEEFYADAFTSEADKH